MTDQQQGNGQEPANEGGHSSDWRNLERARDNWKSKAESWQQTAIRQAARQAGFNPDQGVGSLLMRSFLQDKGEELSPETLEQDLSTYAQDLGVQPESPGEGSQGSSEPTQAESLLENRQATGHDLQQAAQPAQGEKSLQDQIAEAEQAGEMDKAQQLSVQLATEQLASAQQMG